MSNDRDSTTAPVGLVLGQDTQASVRDLTQTAQELEGRGFDMAFFSETMSSNRDSVTALAALALGTGRIRLGATQVVRLRTPLLLAQTAATLDELSGGRLVLALGAFTRRHAIRHGLPPSKPETTLREYVECLRLLLKGDPVTYHGEHVHLDGVGLAWKPKREQIPVWIAANSPGGLDTAGRVGDGVLLDGATSPEYTANAVARIRLAAAAAGRDLAGFEVAQFINVSVAADTAAALEAVRPEIAARFRNQNPAASKLAIGEPAVDPADLPRFLALYQQGGAAELEAAFPTASLAALSASGTAAEVVARVQRYRDAGVDLPLLRPATPEQLPAVLDAFARLPATG